MERQADKRRKLNKMGNDVLVTLLISTQEQIAQQTVAIERLTGQIALMNTKVFALTMPPGLTWQCKFYQGACHLLVLSRRFMERGL